MTNVVHNDVKNGLLTLSNNDSAKESLQTLATPRNKEREHYPKPVLIALKDLNHLTNVIKKKISQLNIDLDSTSMKTLISFYKGKTFQMVGWDALDKFDWKLSETTKKISLTWEFMSKIEGKNKELHILNVTISESIDAAQYLREALSDDYDDMNSQSFGAPVVCTVDYYDSLLSDELINIVSSWHNTLSKPFSLFGYSKLIKDHHEKICVFINYSLKIFLPLAYISGFYFWMNSNFEKEFSVKLFTEAISLALVFYIFNSSFCRPISESISNWAHKNIIKIGKTPIFELTSGDSNKKTEAFSKIHSSTIKLFGQFLVTVIIDVASAIFVYYALGLK